MEMVSDRRRLLVCEKKVLDENPCTEMLISLTVANMKSTNIEVLKLFKQIR